MEYGAVFVFAGAASIQQGSVDFAFSLAEQKAHPVFHNLSLFLQDHWKVGTRLSLDYGVRWEFNPPPGASDGLYPLALTSANLQNAQLAPRGTTQYRTIYHDFAPRFGFAYEAIPGNHALTVRGGLGIFYDTGQLLGVAGYEGYPFAVNKAIPDVPLPAPGGLLAPPPLNAPLTPPYGNIRGLSDPNLVLPYTEQWSLSLDHKLASQNILTLSYVGNGGRKLLFTNTYGQFGQPFPPNPLFTTFNLTTNAASSSYNALQIQDQGYVTSGLQLIAAYTWAHAIDNNSTDNSGFPPIRGNSDNDVRNILNVALNYQVPGKTGSNRIVRALTSGWLLANRLSAQTGYPVDVIQGFYSPSLFAQVPIRPDLVNGTKIYEHNVPGVIGGWALNAAAFSQVALNPDGSPVRQGDLPRNFIHGPAFWNLNTAIQRSFPIREQLHIDLRFDAFNVFNHPNAGGIDTCLCDGSTFGTGNQGAATVGVPNQLYASGGPRSLQIMLSLRF